VGNLSTGEGIARAVAGVELVVHAASDTHRLGRADLEQTRNLLRALDGVHHLVYVSIVGIDAIPFGYYRRKLDCEHEIAASGVPHTILRATQFHELIAMLLSAVEHLPIAPLPVDFRFQSVAAREVAERLVEVLGEEPSGRADDFGGPTVLELGEMARLWRDHRGHPKRVVRLPVPGAVANAFRRGRNTCPDHAAGRESWGDFVRAT
jgi:uncharacterized protein YbjT (DUF2867 family)